MTDPRWTLITGASSGIGAEMARLYAARGRSLVLAARRGDRLLDLKRELEARHPEAGVQTLVVDLERRGAARSLVERIEALGIELHTLVNNAGFGLRGGFATLPHDDQIGMLELNVVSLTELCRLLLPGMLGRRRGGIINVASTAAFQPIPFLATYGATKAYVLSLSEALHEEARRHGVVVTALCPGPTATEFTIRADMEKSKLFSHAMSAETVARLGIEGHESGRAVVITGAANRVGAFGARLAPRTLVRRMAGWLQG